MNESLFCSLLKEHGIEYSENVPMSAHTTFRIGGNAAYYLVPDTEEKLCRAADACNDAGVRHVVLGRGSNVLFDDAGYSGAVISTEKLNRITVSESKLICSCGASFTQCAAAARDASLSGLEFAYGIPGAVGGAVYMNAGAYGGEVSQVLKESTYYETKSRSVCTIPLSEHKYGYRESVYRDCPERLILSAVFELNVGDKKQIKEKMDGFMESRRTKQPLEYPSAGSVFKRCQGHFTGQMIEELGLKGYTVGGAQISEKHAGFIINKGGASSEDVLKLIAFIQKKVHDGYGLDLECEVIHIK